MMPIFKKKTTDELPSSGCGSITAEQVYRISRTLFEDGEEITQLEETFARGFIAGLMFVATPKDAGTHGYGAKQYMENAFSYVFSDYLTYELNDALAEAARGVLENLGLGCGIRVMSDEGREAAIGDDA